MLLIIFNHDVNIQHTETYKATKILFNKKFILYKNHLCTRITQFNGYKQSMVSRHHSFQLSFENSRHTAGMSVKGHSKNPFCIAEHSVSRRSIGALSTHSPQCVSTILQSSSRGTILSPPVIVVSMVGLLWLSTRSHRLFTMLMTSAMSPFERAEQTSVCSTGTVGPSCWFLAGVVSDLLSEHVLLRNSTILPCWSSAQIFSRVAFGML